MVFPVVLGLQNETGVRDVFGLLDETGVRQVMVLHLKNLFFFTFLGIEYLNL